MLGSGPCRTRSGLRRYTCFPAIFADSRKVGGLTSHWADIARGTSLLAQIGRLTPTPTRGEGGGGGDEMLKSGKRSPPHWPLDGRSEITRKSLLGATSLFSVRHPNKFDVCSGLLARCSAKLARIVLHRGGIWPNSAKRCRAWLADALNCL